MSFEVTQPSFLSRFCLILLATLCLALLPNGSNDTEPDRLTTNSQQEPTETAQTFQEGRSMTVMRTQQQGS